MKKLQEKNKRFIKELNENGEYDEKDIEGIFNKYKNDIDILDVIKYFMRNKYKIKERFYGIWIRIYFI